MTTHRTDDGRVLVDVTVLVHALIAACAVGLITLAVGLAHQFGSPTPTLPQPTQVSDLDHDPRTLTV